VLHVTSWLGFSSISAFGAASALLVIAYGLASGALFAAFFTYAADIIPVTRRSEGFGMFGIWGMLPNGLGPLLGEHLIARGGFSLYFFVAAALALTSMCLSLFLPETAHPHHQQSLREPPESGSRFPIRALLSLLVTTFVFGASVNSLFTFLAPFADATGRGSVGSFFMSYALVRCRSRLCVSDLQRPYRRAGFCGSAGSCGELADGDVRSGQHARKSDTRSGGGVGGVSHHVHPQQHWPSGGCCLGGMATRGGADATAQDKRPRRR